MIPETSARGGSAYGGKKQIPAIKTRDRFTGKVKALTEHILKVFEAQVLSKGNRLQCRLIDKFRKQKLSGQAINALIAVIYLKSLESRITLIIYT